MALVFQCRGCFIVMGLSSESVAPPSVWTERDLSPTWGSVSFKSFKREESEKSLSSLELCSHDRCESSPSGLLILFN